MKILLVEDDDLLAEAIARALRAENFVVDVASNGEDGQHLGGTETYDAAVLDLGLPKVNGVAVLRAWRSAGRKLPVLILTARDGWSEKSRASRPAPTIILSSRFAWRKSSCGCGRSCVEPQGTPRH
jgi:DNA-binding response OmpR family regulator